jgi:VIT1/CCC1 family predicted Fe2+/Mn2+ transporter
MRDLEDNHQLQDSQRTEITEHIIYQKLARVTRDAHNREVLERISRDELAHYQVLKKYTGKEFPPQMLRVWWYYLLARILGLTFSLKLMERAEGNAQVLYSEIGKSIPEVKELIPQESVHEQELIDLLDEERLKYVGAVVLGLNDALVELTGALAGLSFALQETRIIAMAGLITGVAASLSMGASEYLSTKSEGRELDPVRASVYTSVAYIMTVLFLIAPFLLFPDYRISLGITLCNALVVIFIFTFYISVARDLSFRKRFTEMAVISLGVAFISFILGVLIRIFLGVEV